MNSDSHREQLLNPVYTQVGLAATHIRAEWWMVVAHY
jgi:uncharacterized protein YkwD